MKGSFGMAGGSGQVESEGSKVAFGSDREFNKNISNRVTFCNIIMNTDISDNDPVAKVWALYWKMKTDLQQLTVDYVEGGWNPGRRFMKKRSSCHPFRRACARSVESFVVFHTTESKPGAHRVDLASMDPLSLGRRVCCVLKRVA